MRTRRLLSGEFWLDAGERVIGSAASAALAAIGVDAMGVLDVAWGTVGALAATAAVVSLLKSVVAGSTGDPTTAGFLTHTR
jgi:Putative lactococcus lactis phage r1t holin